MRCNKCGLEDPVARQYCTRCGAEIDLASRGQLKALRDQKQTERDQNVSRALARMLGVGLVMLVSLLALKSVFTYVTPEPVEAILPVPPAEIAVTQKVGIQTDYVQMIREEDAGYGISKAIEDDVVRELLSKALQQAPKYQIGTKIVHAFVLNKYGDSATIFTEEGKRIVSANLLKQVD